MKFLPMKRDRAATSLALRERRLALKRYIEEEMIPALIEQEGSEFLTSLFWVGQRFVCNLYNEVWNQYAQEKPFELTDFQVFQAESNKHNLLYVRVPCLPGTENFDNSALAFASDISDAGHKNIQSYRVQKRWIERERAVFEVFGPNERVGCTPSMSKREMGNALYEIVKLIWSMSFDDEEDCFSIGEIEDPELMNEKVEAYYAAATRITEEDMDCSDDDAEY